MDRYLLDTNAFNNILDNDVIDAVVLHAQGRIYATHHQTEEINNTKNETRRAHLATCFRVVGPQDVPTESFMLGFSRLGHARLGDGDCCRAIYWALEKCARKTNNAHDALIGETAEKGGFTLVSDDGALREVMTGRGVRVIGWRQLVCELARRR